MLLLCIINSVGRIGVINFLHSIEAVVSISRGSFSLDRVKYCIEKTDFSILLIVLTCFSGMSPDGNKAVVHCMLRPRPPFHNGREYNSLRHNQYGAADSRGVSLRTTTL